MFFLPDSEPTKLFYSPNKNPEWEGASDRETPAAKYLYWSIFKKSRHLGFESISYLVDYELGWKLMYNVLVQCVRPEEEEVGEEDTMELQRLARREKNRPVNV